MGPTLTSLSKPANSSRSVPRSSNSEKRSFLAAENPQEATSTDTSQMWSHTTLLLTTLPSRESRRRARKRRSKKSRARRVSRQNQTLRTLLRKRRRRRIRSRKKQKKSKSTKLHVPLPKILKTSPRLILPDFHPYRLDFCYLSVQSVRQF